MDEEEERLFLERLTLKVWAARRDGSIIGAAYVLGVGLLLYLIMDRWKQPGQIHLPGFRIWMHLDLGSRLRDADTVDRYPKTPGE